MLSVVTLRFDMVPEFATRFWGILSCMNWVRVEPETVIEVAFRVCIVAVLKFASVGNAGEFCSIIDIKFAPLRVIDPVIVKFCNFALTVSMLSGMAISLT